MSKTSFDSCVKTTSKLHEEGSSGELLAGERRYAVVALEPVWHDGFLLGHIERTFYRRQPLDGIDLETFWDDISDDPAQFRDHWEAEQFTEDEARMVIEILKGDFPRLAGFSMVNHHCAQLDIPIPLRVYPDDGAYSQWDLSKYCAQLGFPIAAFADYDISNVLAGEPLCGLRPDSSSMSNRCAFCGRMTGRCSKLGVSIYTRTGEKVCRTCAAVHAPYVVTSLEVAEHMLGLTPCDDWERPWRDHCVDRNLSDDWLEALNSLREFDLISICEGHVTGDCDDMRSYAGIALRIKAHRKQTILNSMNRVRSAIEEHIATAINHRTTSATAQFSLGSEGCRPDFLECSDIVVRFRSRIARTESGAEPSMIKWFTELVPSIDRLDGEVEAAIESATY